MDVSGRTSAKGHEDHGVKTATKELLVPCGSHRHGVIVSLCFWRDNEVVFNPCDSLGKTARLLTGSTCQAWLADRLDWPNEWLEVVYADDENVLQLDSWPAHSLQDAVGALPWWSAAGRVKLARDILGDVDATQLLALIESEQPEQVWASLILMSDSSIPEFSEVVVTEFDNWSRPLQLAAIDCLIRLRQGAGLPILHHCLADESAHIALRSQVVQALLDYDQRHISPLIAVLNTVGSELSYVIEEALRDAVDRAWRDNNGAQLASFMQSGVDWLERDAGLYLSRMGKAAIPYLNELAQSGDPRLCTLVVAALAEMGLVALDTLLSILHDQANAIVRESIARTLGRMGRAATVYLVDLLADPNDRVARQAARSLEQDCDPLATSGLLAALCRDDVRDEVRQALQAILTATKRDASAVPLLLDLLKARETSIAAAAAELLGEIGDSRAKQPLMETCLVCRDVSTVAAKAFAQFASLNDVRRAAKLLKHGDQVAAQGAVEIMVAIGEPSVPTLLKGLCWTYCETRRFSALALGRIADPSSVVPLMNSLNDSVPSVRLTALEALGRIRDPRATDRIRNLLADADPIIRRTAMAMVAADEE